MPEEEQRGEGGRFRNLARTAKFWTRAGGIYLTYKQQQIRAWTLQRQGWDAERLREHHWRPHHTWAGEELTKLAVDLRGFYLKVDFKLVGQEAKEAVLTGGNAGFVEIRCPRPEY